MLVLPLLRSAELRKGTAKPRDRRGAKEGELLWWGCWRNCGIIRCLIFTKMLDRLLKTCYSGVIVLTRKREVDMNLHWLQGLKWRIFPPKSFNDFFFALWREGEKGLGEREANLLLKMDIPVAWENRILVFPKTNRGGKVLCLLCNAHKWRKAFFSPQSDWFRLDAQKECAWIVSFPKVHRPMNKRELARFHAEMDLLDQLDDGYRGTL